MQKKYIIKQKNLQQDLLDYTDYSNSKLSYAKKDEDVLLEVRRYIEDNESIDTQEIINRIFPLDEPHIFISHKSEFASHAIRLANILYDKFSIVSFIDSQVWHHIDDVSEMINHKVSKIREDGNTVTYSHKSTSIVASNMFAMLSSSLFEVMDCSDGFIYIDSNNEEHLEKINKVNAKNLKTQSPWLFLEITYASKLRKKMHVRPKLLAEDAIVIKSTAGTESFSERRKVSFEYSKEIIDSKEISSLSRVLGAQKNYVHPLFNLDRFYAELDRDLFR